MTQEQTAEILFEQALAMQPQDRPAFLDRACANSVRLRAAVEELLIRDAEAGNFLKSPLFALPASSELTEDRPTQPSGYVPAGTHPAWGQNDQFHPGDLLSDRFRVIRFIANGGMGEVYEVEDLQLQGVRLALKTILPEIAGKPSMRRRFEREVLLARRVSHSNLCPIYDIFHCRHRNAEITFLTMKLLSGETLSERIRSHGPMSLREARPIIFQVADALTAAHRAGILHRDIKAANIMLEGEGEQVHASVMDFGLARAYRSDSTVLTADGVAGTPGYVAPELFHGTLPSTSSDVYAFGVMIYNMLTGHLPSVKVNAKSKGVDDPLFGQLPAKWKSTVCQCIEPDPSLRFRTIDEAVSAVCPRTPTHTRVSSILLLALGLIFVCTLLLPSVSDRIRGLLFANAEKHIAILPLDQDVNPESQALGDGLMDSLAGSLSNLEVSQHSLWVVPISDVRRRKVNDPEGALKEFGATIVIRGRFERNKQDVHLQLSLIDPQKHREIGFVDVQSASDDLAALQQEAVSRLIRLMNISVRTDQPTHQAASSRAAYEDYLAGLGYFQRKDKTGNLDLAINSLSNAVKTDPKFALAFAALTQVYTLKYQLTSNPEWLDRASESGRVALSLDSQIPLTYAVLAKIHALTGNQDLAIQEFQRALALDPRDVEALTGLAHVYQDVGRLSEAEETLVRAASVRPNDWTGYNALGIFLWKSKHPQQAVTQFKKALTLTPDNSWCYTNLGLAYQDLDDPAMLVKAEEAFKKSIMIEPTFAAYADLATLYEQLRRFPEAVEAGKHALLLNDQSADAWATLSSAYEWLHEDREEKSARQHAISLYERSVKLNPQDSVAQASLAPLYARKGERQKALESIHISLALAPQDTYVLSEVADTYELLGRRTDALFYVKAALSKGASLSQFTADPDIQGALADPLFARVSLKKPSRSSNE
jgi:serine/threonine-protein kinase